MKLINIIIFTIVFAIVGCTTADARSFGSSSRSFSSGRSFSSPTRSFHYSPPKTTLRTMPPRPISSAPRQRYSQPPVVNHYHNNNGGGGNDSGMGGLGTNLLSGAVGYALGSSNNHDSNPQVIYQQAPPVQTVAPPAQQVYQEEQQTTAMPPAWKNYNPNVEPTKPVEKDDGWGFWTWTLILSMLGGLCYFIYRECTK